jgi:hypothetical protein
VFFAVITLANNGQLLDVEAGTIQDADGLFGFCVSVVDENGGLVLFHDDSLFRLRVAGVID